MLDDKLNELRNRIGEKVKVCITYFVKDKKKDGGKYVTVNGILKKIDEYKKLLVLEDGTEICTSEIVGLEDFV